MGYTPELLVGVLLRTPEETEEDAGSRLLAGEVWLQFVQERRELMSAETQDNEEGSPEQPAEEFTVPKHVETGVAIDVFTGLLANERCPQVEVDAFIAGTKPTRWAPCALPPEPEPEPAPVRPRAPQQQVPAPEPEPQPEPKPEPVPEPEPEQPEEPVEPVPEPEPEQPEEPTEPVTEPEPAQPEEPLQPVEPEEPEENQVEWRFTLNIEKPQTQGLGPLLNERWRTEVLSGLSSSRTSFFPSSAGLWSGNQPRFRGVRSS